MIYNTYDFFCGCGGFGLGFKQAGFKAIGAYDIDKYAIKSYKHNVDDIAEIKDIKEMTWKDLNYADVWTFGFPCQDLSVAGKQKGMIKGETRSGLFYEIMRLLEEVKCYKSENMPKIILAENVKAVKEYLPEIKKEYKKVGYNLYYTLYNSKYWKVAQNRERYYMIGVREDLSQTFDFPVQQTDYIPKLSSVLEKDVDEKYYMPDEKAQKIIEQVTQYLSDKHPNVCALTERRTDESKRIRREYREKYGIDFSPRRGKKVVPRQDDIANCCTSTITIEHHLLQSVYTDKDDCAYCCDANYYKGTSPGDVGKSRRTQIIEPHINVIGRLDMKGTDIIRRVYDPEGLSPTLTTCEGGHRQPKILESKPTYRVRKLTPREFARLQGFPDTFEFIVSNTQLYKQFGNACTVTITSAIAESIKKYLDSLK